MIPGSNMLKVCKTKLLDGVNAVVGLIGYSIMWVGLRHTPKGARVVPLALRLRARCALSKLPLMTQR